MALTFEELPAAAEGLAEHGFPGPPEARRNNFAPHLFGLLAAACAILQLLYVIPAPPPPFRSAHVPRRAVPCLGQKLLWCGVKYRSFPFV